MCCVTEYAPATREHSSDNPQFAQCNNIRRTVNTIVPIWLKSIVVLYVSFDIIKAKFLKAYSFLRAKLKKNCLLLRSEKSACNILNHIFTLNWGNFYWVPLEEQQVEAFPWSFVHISLSFQVSDEQNTSSEQSFFRMNHFLNLSKPVQKLTRILINVFFCHCDVSF